MTTSQFCQRCGASTLALTGSYFNTEMICMKCCEREQAHPHYERARRAELEAVRRGEYNFPGIGMPADLLGVLTRAEMTAFGTTCSCPGDAIEHAGGLAAAERCQPGGTQWAQ